MGFRELLELLHGRLKVWKEGVVKEGLVVGGEVKW